MAFDECIESDIIKVKPLFIGQIRVVTVKCGGQEIQGICSIDRDIEALLPVNTGIPSPGRCIVLDIVDDQGTGMRQFGDNGQEHFIFF